MRDRVFVITGPTAVGKTALSVRLAVRFNGEIVSADSRQVYRRMDIATAKPSEEEFQAARHHLVSVVNPDEDFSLPIFLSAAQTAIRDILSRGRLPFVVGGTPLYVKALTEGWQVPEVPPNPEIRRELEDQAVRLGSDHLYKSLEAVDAVAAHEIGPRNVRRLVRALEVYHTLGRGPSHVRSKRRPPYRFLKIGLTMDRELLYRRIDERIDQQVREGLLDEMKDLVGHGYSYELPSMSSLGYSQLGAYLRGEIDFAGAVERIKFDTHRFVRHQYTWFRRDKEIVWVDATDPERATCEAGEVVSRFIASDDDVAVG